MTFPEAFRNAVQELIAADLTAHETRIAVMSMIPKEHHVKHNH